MNINQLLRKATPALLLLFFAFSASAQMGEIYVESAEYDAGEDIAVTVRGVHIEDAVGVQFSLSWDTLVLDFVSVSDIILDGSLSENFNVSMLALGKIGFLAVDMNLTSLGIMDSSALFVLNFRPLMDGVDTEITFSDAPIGGSINDRDNQPIETNFKNGVISIDMSTGLTNVYSETERFLAAPNPFSESTQLKISLDYASKASLEIMDMNGRVISSTTTRMTAGANQINLTSGNFPSAGPYILRLTTDREQLYRKVVAAGVRN